MKRLSLAALVASSLLIAACGNTTGARVSSGTAMGAATGAVIGSFSANAGRGALIGAGVGALGGVLLDEHARGSFSSN
jgi:hypothetical protein